MKLFYTVLQQEDFPQSDPIYSTGGFCSSSPVSSGEINSLFGNISLMTLEKNKPQYICLVLKNIFNYEISDAELWFEYPQNAQCKFRVALVEPIEREFEATPNFYSKPLYAQFEEANGEEDSIALPTLSSQGLLGIWVERSIDKESGEVKGRVDPDYLYSKFGQEIETLETVNLKIKWTSE